MIRQQVPDHRTCHGECPTSEPTVTMTWYDQLMASSRSEMRTTGNNTFRRIFNCCSRKSASSLQYYSRLPMSYINDQQSILFYRSILTSCSTTHRILVNHKQGFILPLLAKYSIPCLLLSSDTINRCMWNNFLSKTVNAGYINTTCQQLSLCLRNCNRFSLF